MSYIIEQITLSAGFERYDVTGIDDKQVRLENLAKINIFVGENNSGKSRLIRGIARNENNIYELRRHLLPNRVFVRDLESHVLERLQAELKSIDVTSVNDVSVEIEALKRNNPTRGLVHQKTVLEPLINYLESQTSANIQSWGRNGQITHARNSAAREILRKWAQESLQLLEPLREFDAASKRFTHIYIPTLRSLRRIAPNDALKACTTTDYSLPDHVEIFTGQTLYDEIEKLLRGSLGDRNTLRKFEDWLSCSFFNGKSTVLIPRKGQETLTIKIGDEEEKPIHELGDGIQSILILSFPLFRRNDEYVLAFIEEPELFLHPWLQRVFLEVLTGRFPKHQYFLTTHSNHFLDLTLDVESVSVFTLEKEFENGDHPEKQPRFRIHCVSREDRKPLELLGVRNSSVLLSNCTIWVEGITDRRYIAHWLKLHDEMRLNGKSDSETSLLTFHEDLHYSFVEYGGGNITHFSFLEEEEGEKKISVERLCSRLFLVTDQDGAEEGEAKFERQEKLKERLGDRYFCLPCREIENLNAPVVLARVLNNYGDSFKPELELTQELYAQEPIGHFIERSLVLPKKRAASYAQNSGTISDKIGFCGRAIAETKTWDELSAGAKELTLKVFGFIESQNR